MIKNKKYKLAILISHPIQYHVPIFRALAKHPKIDLMVYYCWDFGIGKDGHDIESGARYQWDIPLLEGYNYKFLKNYSPKPSSSWFFGQINPSIMREIWTGNYDGILVHGYSFITNWMAFFFAFFSGTPILFRGIAHLLDSKPWYVNFAKRLILPPLFAICGACLYIGTYNKEYYKAYGVPDKKLFHTPHVVDNDFFTGFYKKLNKRRTQLRKKLGFTDKYPVILYLSRLVSKKRPLWILDAYQVIQRKNACGLLIVGEGPLRSELEERVFTEHIPNVIFTGFLNQTEIPSAYVVADIFVLPSLREETWGLVVNEAMNFGLPIVISDKVGCGPDLVREGENGYIINSPDLLNEKLTELIKDPQKRKRFGDKSKEIIDSWSVLKCVEGTLQALKYIDDSSL